MMTAASPSANMSRPLTWTLPSTMPTKPAVRIPHVPIATSKSGAEPRGYILAHATKGAGKLLSAMHRNERSWNSSSDALVIIPLRTILELKSDVPPCQQVAGGMGHAEVQTPCWSQDTGKYLPRDHLKEDPVSLRALAERNCRRVRLMGAV